MEEESFNLKKILFKNQYVTIFSLGVLLSILSVLVKTGGVSLGKVSATLALFPTYIFILLILAFLFAAVSAYYNKYQLMFIPLLIWILILGVNIRTFNIPQLKDSTTGDWTLAPDLDPFLYLRHAYEISEGKLENPDLMRQAPLGVENYATTNIMAIAIVFVHKILSFLGNPNLTYAAIISPVIFFLISSIGMFLFIRSIFSIRYSKNISTAIAIITSFIYTILPQMLHRTVAGVPEIESLGMVWFWFAFYFFTLAWKSENTKKQIIFGILSGIFTGLMSWTWGGYRYIYMSISLATITFFFFEKDRKKNFLIFSSWIIPAIILELLRGVNLYSIFFRVSDTGFACGVFGILIIEALLFKSKIKEILNKKINLPGSIWTLIISLGIGIIILLIISPKFILELIPKLIEGLLYPFGRGRVGVTVAENKAPYLLDALNSFGSIFWF